MSDRSWKGINRDELREELAALEHRQWSYWAQNLAEREELPDETKEHDRKWARNVIDILEGNGVLE